MRNSMSWHNYVMLVRATLRLPALLPVTHYATCVWELDDIIAPTAASIEISNRQLKEQVKNLKGREASSD